MDKNENLISITEVPAGPYIIKGEFKMINKEGKESIFKEQTLCVVAATLKTNHFATEHIVK